MVLRASGLLGFVDGTNLAPHFMINSEGNITKEVNPSYSAWIQQDQNVLWWINATLSGGVLALDFLLLKMCRLLWKEGFLPSLDDILFSWKPNYNLSSEAPSLSLNMFNKSNISLVPWQQLLALLMMKIWSGPFKTSLRTWSDPIIIEELHVLLLCEEMSLERVHQSQSDYTATALLSSKGNANLENFRGGRRYESRGRGRGR